MNKKIILSLILVLSAFVMQAAPVKHSEAARIARAFLSRNARMMFAAGTELTGNEEEVRPYYVFNIGSDDGFVIVAGDDAVCPVLGYSDKGHIDTHDMPENLRTWLEGYSREIKRLQQLNISPRKHSDPQPWDSIPALLASKWDQKSPFNSRCPYSDSGKYHRPTGCVATAIAQVMYYHRWPQGKTAAIDGYTYKYSGDLGGDGSEIKIEALAPTTFDWDSMLDFYGDKDEYDVKSADAVAELMQYVGHSVKMMYGAKASAAFSQDIPGALVHTFGYKKTTHLEYRADYKTQTEWDRLIYEELSENRPVLYSGVTDLGAGHQFVCDGYENNYFHINWGWSGESDGFFKLELLDPYNQGIGGAGVGSSFSKFQTAVIGAESPIEKDVVYSAGETVGAAEEHDIDIMFSTRRNTYTSLQFDIKLPEGIRLLTEDAGMRFNQSRSETGDHVISCNEISDNTYRIVAYSPQNSLITGREGAIMSITLITSGIDEGAYAAEIFNVVTCDRELVTRNIRGGKFTINVKDTSGIDGVGADKAAQGTVYTLDGKPANSSFHALERGIYVIDGKKQIVR